MQFRQLLFPAYARLTLASQRAARRTSERGQLFLAGTVFSAALGIDTDLTLVYQLFALLLSMTLISRITVRFQQPNIQAQRILPKYATAHEPFVYLIRVTNRGDRVEKNLTISDIPETINPVIDDFLNKKEPYEHTRNAWDRLISWHRFTWLQRLRTGIVIGKTTVATLPVKAEKNIKIEATPLRRGVATLSSINLQKPDPFGLNYHVKSIHKREQIIVLPKRYPIRKSSSLIGGRHFHPGGINSTWSIGESGEFVSLREYRDGDSLKKVHWASSAKLQKLVVKEYEDEYFVRQAVVIDTDTRDEDLFEEMVSVAASFIYQTKNGDALTDLFHADRQFHQTTAGRGLGHMEQQMEKLALIKNTPESFPLLPKGLIAQAHLLSNCLLILADWDSRRENLVNQLRSFRMHVKVCVIHREPRDTDRGVDFVPLDKIARYLLSPEGAPDVEVEDG